MSATSHQRDLNLDELLAFSLISNPASSVLFPVTNERFTAFTRP
jgi:hypothetical protein